ncbi:MAG TPA: anaerobic carbon-monoxide dehydrogenase catalytic subunit [Proteobacteria bacterium]|nr:anaerobic carbon-monoxide dehydrogenase catalytic subunit [Pseudomonadota bacterium]
MANEKKSIDATVNELLEKAREDSVRTAWDRAAAQQPQCGFGLLGLCCRHCSMGPCNINPFGGEPSKGICGATAETIAARHFLRMTAAGAAAHSDHGRGVAETFMAAANGEVEDYKIQDVTKLYKLAIEFKVPVEGREVNEIAKDLAQIVMNEWGKTHGYMVTPARAPLKRQNLWKKLGIWPRNVDREIVEAMHRTHIGVDQDYKSLIMHAFRVALADGWGGSMLATDLQDVLFGTPTPLATEANLGVLKEDHVNIIVHGHEPLLSEMIVAAAQDPEMQQLAENVGAKGINLGGICCTANEILMRHGIPLLGNFLQQELAIVTGVVELMIVDIQCIMQSLEDVVQCYHTKLITTSEKAHIPGAEHVQFEEAHALEIAKKIVKMAIENFPNRRPNMVLIPAEKTEMVAGFSHETVEYLLGGMFRASYRPLNDNIINGKVRGLAGVVGCNNATVTPHDHYHVSMVKELIANDVLVLMTGCGAMAAAKEGLMTPEAAHKYAGKGLAEVCETVGIPPVLHLGSCVDNSRILVAATAVVKEGGLGDDISDLPVAGAAPEWMSEKAISIGHYFVGSGVFTVFGGSFPTLGSKKLTKFLFEEIEEIIGGKWAFEPDPVKAAKLMIEHIDKKRKALGIDKARERVLYDMAARRELEV